MTAQVPDRLLHEGAEYAIAAIENAWPFRPEDHGFEPYPSNTACRRGYYAQYAVVGGALELDALSVTARVSKPPPWRGIEARQGEFGKFDRSWLYRGVALPIRYSGGVIVGRDFLKEFYVHMGFHRPHCFAAVLELLFEDGVLSRATDHSAKMEQVRSRIRARERDAGARRSREEIARFVDEAFSLTYATKWSY